MKRYRKKKHRSPNIQPRPLVLGQGTRLYSKSHQTKVGIGRGGGVGNNLGKYVLFPLQLTQ